MIMVFEKADDADAYIKGVQQGREIERLFLKNIKDVIFHNPATIVKWHDGTKTVVKCGHGDKYDAEKGLALCIVKKAMGNKGNYYEALKPWLEKYEL